MLTHYEQTKCSLVSDMEIHKDKLQNMKSSQNESIINESITKAENETKNLQAKLKQKRRNKLCNLKTGPIRSQESSKKANDERTQKTELRLKRKRERMNKFHTRYLTNTDTLDRASGHLEALQKARLRGRTPTKMAINTLIQREDETFKPEWQTAVKQSETMLTETVSIVLEKEGLQAHL